MSLSYEDLLKRLKNSLKDSLVDSRSERIEIPEPQVIFIGNKSIFRNFMDFPRIFRREPNKILMFLAKELATAASLDGERAIFIGRKDRQSFSVLLNRYIREAVVCSICGSMDTRIERVKRLQFLICEACGARSPTKSL
jgi:translation initiation factor 2 subunit 2